MAQAGEMSTKNIASRVEGMVVAEGRASGPQAPSAQSHSIDTGSRGSPLKDKPNQQASAQYKQASSSSSDVQVVIPPKNMDPMYNLRKRKRDSNERVVNDEDDEEPDVSYQNGEDTSREPSPPKATNSRNAKAPRSGAGKKAAVSSKGVQPQPKGSNPVRKKPETKTELRQQRTELRRAVKERDQEIVRLNKTISKHQKEMDQQELRFSLAQESALALWKKGETVVETDEVVRAKIREVTAMWTPWAKEYAIRNPLVELCQADMERLVAVLRDGFPAASWNSSLAMIRAKQGPSIVLNTILAHFICQATFSRPFFFLAKYPDSGDEIDIEYALTKVFDLGQMGHGSNARVNSWRSHTSQLLDTHFNPRGHRGHHRRQSKVRALKESFYAEQAERFENSYGNILLKSLDPKEKEDSRKELVDMIRQAGNLSSRLCTQRANIGCFYDKEILREPFSIKSELMDPHGSMLLDTNETSRDGQEIDIVVHPAIVAFGGEDAKNYTKHKIWSKAVVWISDEPPQAEVVAALYTLEDGNPEESSNSMNEMHLAGPGVNTGNDEPEANDNFEKVADEDAMALSDNGDPEITDKIEEIARADAEILDNGKVPEASDNIEDVSPEDVVHLLGDDITKTKDSTKEMSSDYSGISPINEAQDAPMETIEPAEEARGNHESNADPVVPDNIAKSSKFDSRDETKHSDAQLSPTISWSTTNGSLDIEHPPKDPPGAASERSESIDINEAMRRHVADQAIEQDTRIEKNSRLGAQESPIDLSGDDEDTPMKTEN